MRWRIRTTVKVDLTRQTKQWNRIQIASAFTLFVSLDQVVTMPFDIIKDVYTEQSFDYTGLLVRIPLFLLALFMIWQTWKHGSLFSRHSFKKLRYAFGIAAFMMLLLCTVIGGILTLGNNAGQWSEAELKPLVIAFSGVGFFFIGCVVVTVAIGRLTGSKINAIGSRRNPSGFSQKPRPRFPAIG